MRKLVKKSVALVCAVMCTMGYAASLTACEKDTIDKEVTVYMPDGAPALAMAGLMANDTEDDGIRLSVPSDDRFPVRLILDRAVASEEQDRGDLVIPPVFFALVYDNPAIIFNFLDLIGRISFIHRQVDVVRGVAHHLLSPVSQEQETANQCYQ